VIASLPARESDTGSVIEVRTLPDGALRGRVVFARGQFPDRAALDATGKTIAVAIADYPTPKPLFAADPPGRVRIVDLLETGENRLRLEQGGFSIRPDRLAFAPDGRRLATAGGNDHATMLWEIVGNELKLMSRSVGKSLPIWSARLSEDGRTIGFQTRRHPTPTGPNARGAGEWSLFRLDRNDWATTGSEQLVEPETSRNGWEVGTTSSEYVWTIRGPGVETMPLPWNRLQDDRPQCYTFLPGRTADSVRLAVGHLWGISLFHLRSGEKPVLERKLTGHVGFVMSVAPALGGKALISSGRDQVIALWSLAEFPSQAILGADFDYQDDRATVRTVDAGSPAEEAGLSSGDTITRLAFDGNWLPVAEWKARLTNPVPMKELAFQLRKEGIEPELACKTAVLHRPVARFAPFHDGEWVLYTYRQCYYTCSTNGDYYIRWQRNGANAGQSPELFRVEQFPGLRQRAKVADVVERLVREPCAVIAPDRFPPQVRLELAAQEVNGGSVQATVTLTPRLRPDGRPASVDLLELVLNGHHRVAFVRLGDEKLVPGQPIRRVFEIPATLLRSGPNRVEAIATALDAGYEKSPPELLRNLAVRGNRRIFGLVAGINTYQAVNQINLRSPVGDARKIFSAWSGQRGHGAFSRGVDSHLRFIAEQNVTREAILAAVHDAKEATPDDLFVLFLAGHGVQMPDGKNDWYYVIPYVKTGVPVAEANWTQSSLQDDELLRALTDELKCQPVVFLDCCHSGAAGRRLPPAAGVVNQTRSLRSHGFGPVVISACSAEELAWEDEERGGYFASRIANALGAGFTQADTDGDGLLSAEELFRSVRIGVAEDIRGKAADGEPIRQTPQMAPPAELLPGLILAGRPAN
jgi:WD40 repeat protein